MLIVLKLIFCSLLGDFNKKNKLLNFLNLIESCSISFFPERDEHFNLQIPTGEVFDAKVCQDNSKALMTNPNKALSDWLLRTVLQLKERELLTIGKLNALGVDSVIINKDANGGYIIDIMTTNSYVRFCEHMN